MKKLLIISALGFACAWTAVSNCSAQSATFLYNDGSGTPNVGDYTPGSSFTFSINLVFTPGGSVSNLGGLSYWFQQQNPNSPFNFAITLRDASGSQFTDLQSPSIAYPQNLNPDNANDLGALLPVGQPGLGASGSGGYFVANLTISIAANTAPGTYTIQNIISGGKTAFVFNDTGSASLAIPAATYTINVVPEPATIALLVGGGLLAWTVAWRRRASAS